MLYIEDFMEESQRNKDFGFTIDERVPTDLRVDVWYREREMLSLSIQDTDKYTLYDICRALVRAFSEGELYGRFKKCLSTF